MPDGKRDPVVLHSDHEARAVLIELKPGESLGDHQVKENAWLCVVEGNVRVGAGGETVDGGAGDALPLHARRAALASRATRAPGCCSCSRRGPARGTTAAAPRSSAPSGLALLRLRVLREAPLVGAPHDGVHEVAERQEEADQHDVCDDHLAERRRARRRAGDGRPRTSAGRRCRPRFARGGQRRRLDRARPLALLRLRRRAPWRAGLRRRSDELLASSGASSLPSSST